MTCTSCWLLSQIKKNTDRTGAVFCPRNYGYGWSLAEYPGVLKSYDGPIASVKLV